MKNIFFASTLLFIASVGTSQAATLLLEDFEDAVLTYTSNVPDNFTAVADGDYFGRAGSTDLPSDVTYLSTQGIKFYTVQDSDSVSGAASGTIVLDWVGVDISDHTNLNLTWFVAESDATNGFEDWDATTNFQIDAQIDGAGYNSVFSIRSELGVDGNQTNERARVDTDFDGVGDGAEITNAFSEFAASLADGSLLDIQVSFFDLNGNDEDLAFDNLKLTGDIKIAAVPVPAGLALMLPVIGAFGVLGARRRRRASGIS